jgi:hypothetical protein
MLEPKKNMSNLQINTSNFLRDNFPILLSLCLSLAILSGGCALSHALSHPFSTGPEASVAKLPPSNAESSAKLTTAITPTKAFFNRIMMWCIIAGSLSLLAGGALIYFGMVIPGVKCVAGGIALPVAAIWIDYHYAVVIWTLCIGSAIGFVWALKKYDPALAKQLIADWTNAAVLAEKEVTELKAKL